eukprot:CAMPEP_0172575372 /NCGR_PEP_ID=MMETSP1067-20121228/137178_1 /TAXON_ID=265564 ORGANISM="Thalassiosira punctigera, Strain Tpunct2005C2" /NCGR_SAMPLE_ID=MMETSP1067 /ASSEMBLY_ACC=CAM_ASM_000444 /LENGTH=280 /DNA_ID=CAMNT_0013368021 /DNA_START=50 /DNA_END=892 /DNA_ORIENTATION=-
MSNSLFCSFAAICFVVIAETATAQRSTIARGLRTLQDQPKDAGGSQFGFDESLSLSFEDAVFSPGRGNGSPDSTKAGKLNTAKGSGKAGKESAESVQESVPYSVQESGQESVQESVQDSVQESSKGDSGKSGKSVGESWWGSEEATATGKETTATGKSGKGGGEPGKEASVREYVCGWSDGSTDPPPEDFFQNGPENGATGNSGKAGKDTTGAGSGKSGKGGGGGSYTGGQQSQPSRDDTDVEVPVVVVPDADQENPICKCIFGALCKEGNPLGAALGCN